MPARPRAVLPRPAHGTHLSSESPPPRLALRSCGRPAAWREAPPQLPGGHKRGHRLLLAADAAPAPAKRPQIPEPLTIVRSASGTEAPPPNRRVASLNTRADRTHLRHEKPAAAL